MKKVITYGSFDLFHEGHYNLLKRAKALGDYLIVGVTTEQYDEARGKVGVVDSLIERIDHVRQSGFADEVIIEEHVGQKIEDIQKYGIDIFTVGSDWVGRFDYLRDYCEVIYLERTKGVSSTMLRNKSFGIVRLGIIGSGRIVSRLIPEAVYVSGINVHGIYNPHIDSARKLTDKYGLAMATDDLNELLESVDAVYVATPHEYHVDYTRKTLEAGKHVLCEKPMAFTSSDAKEIFELARSKGLIVMEALKTAYLPGFIKLVSTCKSGNIGRIKDLEACFTKLIGDKNERVYRGKYAGSFAELGSYPLIPIIKILGEKYQDIRFVVFEDENGNDLYTRGYLEYEDAIASIKVGLGVKSEGELVVSATNGYLLAESPWWLTKGFELRYENFDNNERFFTKYAGEGFRYELAAFVGRINGRDKYQNVWKPDDSIAMAGVMERFFNGENIVRKRI